MSVYHTCLPVMNGGSFAVFRGSSGLVHLHASAVKSVRFTSGSTALAALLRHCIPEGKILCPSYHCSSLIDPIRINKRKYVFFDLNDDLSPNMDSIREVIAHSRPQALIANHFFGRVYDFSELRRLADSEGIVFIEDCAHLFEWLKQGVLTPGQYGHYGIASQRKFYPVYEGGSAWANIFSPVFSSKRKLGIELRAIKNLPISRSLPVPGSASLPRSSNAIPAEEEIEPRFDTGAAGLAKQSLCSSLIMRLASVKKITARRLTNFKTWQEQLQGLPRTHCPLPQLESQDVPYVYPLALNDAERDLSKTANLPYKVWHWKALPLCEQPKGFKFSKDILQLPCHQSLNNDDIVKMAQKLRNIISSATSS